jgi:hypothetical protein
MIEHVGGELYFFLEHADRFFCFVEKPFQIFIDVGHFIFEVFDIPQFKQYNLFQFVVVAHTDVCFVFMFILTYLFENVQRLGGGVE